MKNKSKLFLSLIAVLLLAIGICGCSSSKSVDDQFIDALKSGLSARWKLIDTNEKSGKESTKSDWEKYVESEYSQISEFKDKKFENEELGKWASSYIDSIEKTQSALDYFGTDKFWSDYNGDIYQQRTRAVYNINKIKPLEFESDSDKSELNTLLIAGEASEMASKIQSEMKFELKKDEYGYKQYEAVWENTTSSKFDYFQIDIALIDASGVTVDTAHASAENWGAGEKTLFKFGTNSDFAKMEIKSMSWSY